MTRKSKWIAAGAAIGASLGVVAVLLANVTPTREPRFPADPRVTASANDFAFRLYAQLAAANRDRNLFVCPVSIGTALAELYNGAAGTTQSAMAKTLGVDGIDLATINRGYAGQMDSLEHPTSGVTTNVANSLWVDKATQMNAGFLAANREFYGAQVTNLLLQDSGSVTRMNDWVRRNTRGRIGEIVQPGDVNDFTALVLLNAVYFYGRWGHPFDRSDTKPGSFTVSPGITKSVLMMSRQVEFPYLQGNGFQAVALPYGDGGMSMVLFRPADGVSLQQVEEWLNPQRWKASLPESSPLLVRVVLPRFRMEYQGELQPPLTALGMGVAFDRNQADFSRMCAHTTSIDKARHKTLVVVNEEGTEAAAATGEFMAAKGAPEATTVVFDRPFFRAIQDDRTGAILFMGHVVDPDASGGG